MSDDKDQTASPDQSEGKTPLQASGAGAGKNSDAAGTDLSQGRTQGESEGGAYPNPHTGKEAEGKSEGFHGGQSKTAYHGGNQLGEEDVAGKGNANSGAKKG